jgi:hypothetical protein
MVLYLSQAEIIRARHIVVVSGILQVVEQLFCKVQKGHVHFAGSRSEPRTIAKRQDARLFQIWLVR